MKAINHYQLKALFADVPVIFPPRDLSYFPVSVEWATGEGAIAFDFWLKDQNVPGWEKKFQCEDFADAFSLWLRFRHRESIRPEEAPAVATLFYRVEGGLSGHAINVLPQWAEGKNGLELVPVFIEPNGCHRVRLTPWERNNQLGVQW